MMENRRTFLKKMAVGAAALYGVKDFAFGSSGYNGRHEKKVRIALIGKGSMGTSDVRTALSVGGVKLVAVCDLFDRRVNEAKKMWGDRIFISAIFVSFEISLSSFSDASFTNVSTFSEFSVSSSGSKSM